MRRRGVLVVAIILLLFPAQVLAAEVCLVNQFGHHIFLILLAGAGQIGFLGGAWLFGNAPCFTAPLAGTGWVLADGNYGFGLTINGPNELGCDPYSVEGTLNAADGFSKGSGFYANLSDVLDAGPLTFTPGAPGSCTLP